MFSFFQMATGDSWASQIVRPMWLKPDDQEASGWIPIFFVSYIFVVGLVLMNGMLRPPPLDFDFQFFISLVLISGTPAPPLVVFWSCMESVGGYNCAVGGRRV